MTSLKLKKLDYAAAFGFFVYAASVVVTPIVLLALARDLSFGLAEGGGIEAVRAALLVVILIASGFAAARWGKIAVLFAGGLVFGAGLLVYALAPAYSVVLAGMVLVGLGSGLLEALINPLVQDVHPEDSGRYLNIVNAFFSVGVLAAVLIAGELLTRGVSWRIIVGSIGVLAAVSGLLFIMLGRGHQRPPATSGSAAATFQHGRTILREPVFWVYAVAIFCGGGAEGAFTFWSATYIQLNFDTLARGGAIGTAVFAGGMVAGRLLFGRFVHQRRLATLILLSAAGGTVISLAAYFSGGIGTFFLVLFGAGVSIACFWPSIQSHAAATMRVDSTMLFILLSVAGIPGFGFTSWMMGILADRFSLRASLLVVPGLLAVLAAVMFVPRTATRRR